MMATLGPDCGNPLPPEHGLESIAFLLILLTLVAFYMMLVRMP